MLVMGEFLSNFLMQYVYGNSWKNSVEKILDAAKDALYPFWDFNVLNSLCHALVKIRKISELFRVLLLKNCSVRNQEL